MWVRKLSFAVHGLAQSHRYSMLCLLVSLACKITMLVALAATPAPGRRRLRSLCLCLFCSDCLPSSPLHLCVWRLWLSPLRWRRCLRFGLGRLLPLRCCHYTFFGPVSTKGPRSSRLLCSVRRVRRRPRRIPVGLGDVPMKVGLSLYQSPTKHNVMGAYHAW